MCQLGPQTIGGRASRGSGGCVWPANCRSACGAPAQQGRICRKHLERVQGLAGTLACAWPGCTRRAWDCKGLCSFHWKVAFGLIKH